MREELDCLNKLHARLVPALSEMQHATCNRQRAADNRQHAQHATCNNRGVRRICADAIPRTGARPSHICTGTDLTAATSAPGLGLAPPTSEPGLGSSTPQHLDYQSRGEMAGNWRWRGGGAGLQAKGEDGAAETTSHVPLAQPVVFRRGQRRVRHVRDRGVRVEEPATARSAHVARAACRRRSP
jgi:hypothetical protein